MNIEFNSKVYTFKWYRGEVLKSSLNSPIAFDTETEAIPPYRPLVEGEDPREVPPSPIVVPELAVGMAFDGEQLFLIHPTRMKEFVGKNRNHQWVGHNFVFDFWVLMEHAKQNKDVLTQEFLWQMGDANKFSDTAILDLLLQLGTGKYRYTGTSGTEDKKLFMANLGMLAEEWKCGELDKEDPYRLRFGEWIGLTEEQIEALPDFTNFVSYSLKDVIVTHAIYPLQREKGIAIMKKVGWSDKAQKTYEIRPDALKKFGCLSEYIQVKGAIALAKISRTPIYVDTKRRDELEAATRERYKENMKTLIKLEPLLFDRYSKKARNGKAGKIKYNEKTKLPKMRNLVLMERLGKIAKELNIDPPISKGKNENISLSIKDWQPIADNVREEHKDSDAVKFLHAWCGLGAEVKLLSFFISLRTDDGKVYSNYNLLMRTGRTSASAHKRGKMLLVPSFNIQQMPREDSNHPERSVRTLFLPPPGTKWGSFDYSYIELCSLAATTKARFGFSKLAETINKHQREKGLDPHEYTATISLKISPEDFRKLDKNEQKKFRQYSKSINFGFMGGLGIDKFIVYAKTQFGATFTKKEAKEAKLKWMEAYPEMKLYLSDPSELSFKWNTELKTAIQLNFPIKKRLSDYLKASEKDRNKGNYSDKEVEYFWEILSYIAKFKEDEELKTDCINRKVTTKVRNLTTYRSCNLTGRVRNLVTYTAGANSPPQGSAGDGAKVALWNLIRRGITVMAFIHDSCEIAIPEGKEKQMEPLIKKIMIDSMKYVLEQDISVNVDSVVSTRWDK